MDIQALKQELTDQSGTYAGMTPAEIAAKLNLADSVVQGPLPIAQMLIWSAQTGAIKRFKAWVAADVEPLATVAEVALRLLDLGIDLDVTNAEVSQLFTVITGEDKFTQAEIDNLFACGQKTVSRAEQLGVGRVTEQDVIDAQNA
jgi:hypothetical protein